MVSINSGISSFHDNIGYYGKAMEHYLKALPIPEERALGAEHHIKQVQEKRRT